MKKIVLGFLLLLAQPAMASMSLDKIIVYLTDMPNARDDIVVTNPDKENLYLQTEVFRVDNPGKPDEKRVRVVDPKEFKLLVSPAKAVLPPGEQKRFRLMSVEGGLKQEQVYRVNFRPVVGDIKTDRTALKILVAYQALVFVQPENGRYRLSLENKDGKFQIRNSGNIHVELVDVKFCPESTPNDCRPLKLHGRVYAGASKRVDEGVSGGQLVFMAKTAKDSVPERLSVP